jgi:hypothetical protein
MFWQKKNVFSQTLSQWKSVRGAFFEEMIKIFNVMLYSGPHRNHTIIFFIYVSITSLILLI